MNTLKFLLVSRLLISSVMMQAQEALIFGKWKTIDDTSGEPKAIIEIYKKDGKVFGRIEEILNPNDREKTCIYCQGDEYNVPLIGLDIIKGLEKDGNAFEGGTIFDPENGRTYRTKIWVDDKSPKKLNVRGYISFFFRTQQWVRFE